MERLADREPLRLAEVRLEPGEELQLQRRLRALESPRPSGRRACSVARIESTSASSSVSVCPGRGVTMTSNSPAFSFGLWKLYTFAADCLSYTSALVSREMREPSRMSASTSSAYWSSLFSPTSASEIEPRNLHAILERPIASRPAVRRRERGPHDRLARAEVGEVLRDPRLRLRRIEVAGDGERRVVRRVVQPEERLHVLDRRRRQIGHAADHGPRIRMSVRIHRGG